MLTIREVVRKIKDFSKRSPRDNFDEDPTYRKYLAVCSMLLELDVALIALNEQEEDDYYYLKLNEINDEVEQLTKKGNYE